MEVNRSNFDVLVKGVFVEQNRTPSIMCHIETIRKVLAVEILNCFLQVMICHFTAICFSMVFFPRRGRGYQFFMLSLFRSVKRLGTSASKRYSSLEECSLSGASRNAGFAPFASTMWRCRMVSGSDFTQAENPYGRDKRLGRMPNCSG